MRDVKVEMLQSIGTEIKDVVVDMTRLLDNPKAHNKQMSEACNTYDDGKTSEHVVEALAYEYGVTKNSPSTFCISQRI